MKTRKISKTHILIYLYRQVKTINVATDLEKRLTNKRKVAGTDFEKKNITLT
jgi:hypothetical protein